MKKRQKERGRRTTEEKSLTPMIVRLFVNKLRNNLDLSPRANQLFLAPSKGSEFNASQMSPPTVWCIRAPPIPTKHIYSDSGPT